MYIYSLVLYPRKIITLFFIISNIFNQWVILRGELQSISLALLSDQANKFRAIVLKSWIVLLIPSVGIDKTKYYGLPFEFVALQHINES